MISVGVFLGVGSTSVGIGVSLGVGGTSVGIGVFLGVGRTSVGIRVLVEIIPPELKVGVKAFVFGIILLVAVDEAVVVRVGVRVFGRGKMVTGVR
jgi:hypothetical protein